MINYNPKSWLKLIFAIHKSDTLQMLWKELLYMGLFTLFIAYIELHYFPKAYFLKELVSVYSLIGFVISLLLVFRTNTAYDRWWEGRRKWGELVNDTRNLSVKFASLLDDKSDRETWVRLIPSFVFAMKEHLRKGIIWEQLSLNPEEFESVRDKKHVPLAIVQLMYAEIRSLKKQGKISEQEFIVLDTNLHALMNSCGACERIKNTPIPYSYSLFLKKFIFVYVTTMPLAFVTTFGYYAALIATFVFYVLVSIEVLAEEIEDPFGTDDNDLPTDDLAERIKVTVTDVLS